MLIWPGRILSVSPSQIFSRILKYREEMNQKSRVISFRTFINALIIFTNISVEFFAFVCFSGRSCWVFFLNIFLKIDNGNLKLHRLNIYIQYRSSLIVGIFASPNISSSSATSIFLSKVMEISKHWDLFEYSAIRGLCCTETAELITELTRNCYLNVEWIMTAFYFVCHGSKKASLFCDIISTEFENTELDNDN